MLCLGAGKIEGRKEEEGKERQSKWTKIIVLFFSLFSFFFLGLAVFGAVGSIQEIR